MFFNYYQKQEIGEYQTQLELIRMMELHKLVVAEVQQFQAVLNQNAVVSYPSGPPELGNFNQQSEFYFKALLQNSKIEEFQNYCILFILDLECHPSVYARLMGVYFNSNKN